MDIEAFLKYNYMIFVAILEAINLSDVLTFLGGLLSTVYVLVKNYYSAAFFVLIFLINKYPIIKKCD